MAYDLMLLGDPGAPRERVLRALRETPNVEPDPSLPDRFWLRLSEGTVQINTGSKDPVESVHLEVGEPRPALLEAATLRALELADRLEMRLEDLLWGHEVTLDGLPELRNYWASLNQPAALAQRKDRPWWRFW